MIIDMNYWTKVFRKILIFLFSILGIYLGFKLAVFYMPFLIAFILSFLIDFVLLLVLNTLTKPLFDENLALLISVVGARIISSLFNFFFNRNIVFQNKSNIFKSLVQYYALAICVIIVYYLLLNLLLHPFLSCKPMHEQKVLVHWPKHFVR